MDKQELIDTLSELKLTQREAAEHLGVNVRTVRRWMSGEATMKGSSKFALILARQANRAGLNWRL